MLGKIEERRRRGWPRMKWLDGITESMEMSLSIRRSMEMEMSPGDGEGWGSLACCSPWGGKRQTWLSNWTTAEHQEIPDTDWYTQHAEKSVSIFPRICPSGLNGPYLGTSGAWGELVLGLFIMQMGHVSTTWLIILFMQRVTKTSTNQLLRASLQ